MLTISVSYAVIRSIYFQIAYIKLLETGTMSHNEWQRANEARMAMQRAMMAMMMRDDDDDPKYSEENREKQFPKALIGLNPTKKDMSKTNYFDVLYLCGKFCKLIEIGRDPIANLMDNNPYGITKSDDELGVAGMKIDDLLEDVKKIRDIAMIETKKALDKSIGPLPDDELTKRVEQMIGLKPEPRGYGDQHWKGDEVWKIKDNYAPQVKGKIEKVYQQLAKVYETLSSIGTCITFDCLIPHHNLDWDDEDWKKFIRDYENAEEALKKKENYDKGSKEATLKVQT